MAMLSTPAGLPLRPKFYSRAIIAATTPLHHISRPVGLQAHGIHRLDVAQRLNTYGLIGWAKSPLDILHFDQNKPLRVICQKLV